MFYTLCAMTGENEVEKVTWQMKYELLQKQSSNFNVQIIAIKEMIQKQQWNKRPQNMIQYDYRWYSKMLS